MDEVRKQKLMDWARRELEANNIRRGWATKPVRHMPWFVKFMWAEVLFMALCAAWFGGDAGTAWLLFNMLLTGLVLLFGLSIWVSLMLCGRPFMSMAVGTRKTWK